MDLGSPIFRSRAAQERDQRAPVELSRERDAESFQNGRHQVHGFGKIVNDPAARGVGFRARVADDTGHMEMAVEIAAPAVKPVVAELIAMIGAENDNCIIVLRRFFKTRNQAADLRVDLRAVAVIGGAHGPVVGRRAVAGRDGAAEIFGQALVVDEPCHPGMLRADGVGSIGARR